MITIPVNVRRILDTLHGAGFEAYAVGGCVRDSLIGRVPDDWDITTSARPEEVKALFRRTIDTGIKHGTVTVMFGRTGYEVTTYRVDGVYGDGRHPDSVSFTRSLDEDLKRRDFTINAMAFSEEEGLIDRFGGRQDLENGVIRCVGSPEERLSEDALRILRAVRFAAQLGFDIEEDTRLACTELAERLEVVSAERIRVELVKLLVSAHPEKLVDASGMGITSVFLPEFDTMLATAQNNPHHRFDVGRHSIEAVKLVDNDPVLRLTMLLHDVAKPLTKTTDENGRDHFYGHEEMGAEVAEKILKRLKFDNATIRRVTNLVRYHDERYPATKKNVRRAIYRVGKEDFPLMFQVMRADCLAQSTYEREEKLKRIDDIHRLYEEILSDGECLNMKDLAVHGRDLLELGVAPGKEMGRILDNMLMAVIDDPSLNDRDKLLSMLDKLR